MARTEPRPPRGAFRGGDRRTLIAGNWKMNLTHLEAIGLVQKLVFSVPEAVLDTVEAVVLPPFPALRSGPPPPPASARGTAPRTTPAPTPVRSAARCSRHWPASTSPSATPSGGRCTA